MQTKTSRICLTLFICLVTMVLISACQTLRPTPPEQALRQRVENYMTAKINNDWATVHAHMDSEYRKTIDQNQFAKTIRQMEFKNFTIESLEMNPSGEKAVVVVKSDVNVQGLEFKGNPETQTWIIEMGKWFLHRPLDPKEGFK